MLVRWNVPGSLQLYLTAPGTDVLRQLTELDEPVDGRFVPGSRRLLLSVDASKEPREQIEVGTKSQQVFGIDATQWKGSERQVFDGKVLGYPRLSLADIPAGTYRTRDAVSSGCYWMVAKSGTNGEDILSNDLPSGGHPQVSVKRGQDFKTDGCGTWVKIK